MGRKRRINFSGLLADTGIQCTMIPKPVGVVFIVGLGLIRRYGNAVVNGIHVRGLGLFNRFCVLFAFTFFDMDIISVCGLLCLPHIMK